MYAAWRFLPHIGSILVHGHGAASYYGGHEFLLLIAHIELTLPFISCPREMPIL